MGLLSLLGLQRKPRPRSVLDLLSTPGPADDFWYGPAAPQNPSGVPVDENVALTYSACWAATRLYCGTMGMLPLNLYESLPGGGSEIDYDHPLQRILHDEPNNESTSMTFRASRINQQVNRGNCFAEIARDGGGRVTGLWPICASRIPRQNIERRNGTIYYLVNNPDGTKTPIAAENMFHVPSIIADDGIYGRGVVENARLTIGFGLATEKHGAAYFGNGARPGLIIKGAKFRKPEDSEEFRRQWETVHGGPDQHGKPGILPPDADITVLPFNAQDSQFLESRQHTVEEIARWYGVPPHLIGHLLRATFSNIEHQGIEFVKYSLMPWLKLWEQEIWRKLLTKEEQKTYYAKFVVDALERGDKPSRTAANVQEFFNGMLTLNQWASREDMNPIGPLGDIHFVQQAMVPLEVAAKGPQQPEPAPEPVAEEPEPEDEPIEEPADEDQPEDQMSVLREQVEQLRSVNRQLASAMLRDVFRRTLSVEVNAVKRVAEKASKFDTRLREFYSTHTATIERNMLEPITVLLSVTGDLRQPSEVTRTLAERHTAESLQQLDGLLDCTAEQLPARVDECVSKWHEERTTVTV